MTVTRNCFHTFVEGQRGAMRSLRAELWKDQTKSVWHIIIIMNEGQWVVFKAQENKEENTVQLSMATCVIQTVKVDLLSLRMK